jgi:histidinol dehydrogenase
MIRITTPCEFRLEFTGKNARNTATAIAAAVSAIIADVVNRGDAALREYTEKFDGCLPEQFELPPSTLDAALHEVGNEFVGIMEHAARNIEDFHRRQIREGFIMTPGNGAVLGQRIIPLRRVGLYIPGGTAAYPSSVLMNCIPAKIAGVSEVIIATPPS